MFISLDKKVDFPIIDRSVNKIVIIYDFKTIHILQKKKKISLKKSYTSKIIIFHVNGFITGLSFFPFNKNISYKTQKTFYDLFPMICIKYVSTYVNPCISKLNKSTMRYLCSDYKFVIIMSHEY